MTRLPRRVQPRQSGFTLVEVMVAVAIIAVALPALIAGLLSQIDSVSYLRDKIEAQLVAENVMEELRIRNALSGEVPKKEEDTKEMGVRQWSYVTEFKEYPQEELKNIFAVEIRVYPHREDGDIDISDKEKPVAVYYGSLLKREKQAITRKAPEEYPVKRNTKS